MQTPYDSHKDHSEGKQMREIIWGKPHRMVWLPPSLTTHTYLQVPRGNHQIETLGIRERSGKEGVK